MTSTADQSLAGMDRVNRKLDRVTQSGTYVYGPAFLAVPLKRRGRPLGVLALQKGDRDEPFAFSATELLQNIANQAALAIEANQLKQSEERVYFETVSALALAVEAKDPYTRGHSQRVSEIAVAIAREMGLPQEDVDVIRDSALLHDIGKIGIPDDVLGKPGPLSEQEYRTVQQHPLTGRRILMPLASLRRLQDPVRHHHERPDGKGYPEGLSREQIDARGAILAVADSLDAMLSDRPYRNAYSLERARREMERCAGTQFDEEVVRALMVLIRKGGLPGRAAG
jgi:putative nucleotidyltransferase with HDIG domain